MSKFCAAGWGDSPWTRAQSGVPPEKSFYQKFSSPTVRTVANRHRRPAYYNKHCRRLTGVPTTITLGDFELPKYRVFNEFYAILGSDTFQERTASKSTKIDQDNMHTKFLALNVIFNSISFDPPRFKEPSVGGHQIWVPPWNVRFLLLSTTLA